MKAALLNKNGIVIGEVFDAPEKGNIIELAGGFTHDGTPINIKKYKISRSKINLEKAKFEQPVSKVKNVWTFFCVENDEVCY